jgi:AcrR family transcriptional regulator
MPYTPEHRAQTKQKVTEAARTLFNTRGFDGVSIDQIMAEAGLSRGGFYHHFNNKEELFAATVDSFCAAFSEEVERETNLSGPPLIQAFMDGYLGDAHFEEPSAQCPMIAVPSDVSRAGPAVKKAYQNVLETMLGMFEGNSNHAPREVALTLCMLSIGGMVIARAIDDVALQDELRAAARAAPTNLGLMR